MANTDKFIPLVTNDAFESDESETVSTAVNIEGEVITDKEGVSLTDFDNNFGAKINDKFQLLSDSLGLKASEAFTEQGDQTSAEQQKDFQTNGFENNEAATSEEINQLKIQHQEEIEQLKKDFELKLSEEIEKSHSIGEQKAKSEYHDKNEEEGMAILSIIEKEISRISLTQEEWLQKYSLEVAELVTSLLKRILPVYEKENGDKEILAFIKQVLTYVVDKPKLQIQIPRKSAHLAKEIASMLKKAGAGFGPNEQGLKFQIVTNGVLSNSECVIKWQDGLIERKMADLWKEIDETIAEIKTLSEKKSK